MRRAVVGDRPLVLVMVREVTERKEREQELRQLTEEYEAVFENADDAIFLVDVASTGPDDEFRFERLNPAHEAATGMRTAEIRGKTPREVLGEDTGSEVAANYRRCVEAGEPITYQEELEMPDGRFTWQTSLAPVVVEGEVTRIVGIARDVTERVERERQLEQQNERLEEFASIVSHDLRNPLNVAQGRATLLDAQCDDDYREHLDPLVDALERIEAIIEDTLTLAREARLVSETEPVTIATFVGQCWGMVDTGDATLAIADEFTVRGDRDRLPHVFENLFRNAVEHGSTGNQPAADDAVEHGSTSSRPAADDAVEHGGDDVTVRVGRAGDHGFYVEDDGPGIPTDERAAVFEPGHSSDSDGTGFGLSIVKRIVEAHGWDVTVTDATDGGARFEFTGVDIQ